MTNIENVEQFAGEVLSNDNFKNKLSSYFENLMEFVNEIKDDKNKINLLEKLSESFKVEHEAMIKKCNEEISQYTREELLNATEKHFDLLNNPENFEILKEKLSSVPN